MVNRVIHGSRVTAGTDAPGILEDASADFPRTLRAGRRFVPRTSQDGAADCAVLRFIN